MKLVFASIFAAATARYAIDPKFVDPNPMARSIIDRKKAYNPDDRPTDAKTVAPGTWLEELENTIGTDCQVNPWLLNFLLVKSSKAGDTTVDPRLVRKSLMKCKDNDAVKHIFTIEYMMEKKPDIFKNLLEDETLKDGSDHPLGKPSPIDHDGDGTNDYLVDFLQLKGKDVATAGKAQSFKDNLKDWSKSKVLINMMKWKYYNDMFNTMSLQKYQYWKRKVNSLKDQKKLAKEMTYTAGDPFHLKHNRIADETGKTYSKLDQFREYQPLLKPFARRRYKNVPAKPIVPVQQYIPAQPIIPAQPMPVAVSAEEQAEEQQQTFVLQQQYLPVVPIQ